MKQLLYVFAALLLASQVAHAEKPLTLLANTAPPYADRALPEQGLALELVRHIYSRTEYAPEVTIESWSRAMEGVRLGVYDALATAWRTPEREADFLFSEPYLGADLVLLKKRGDAMPYRQLEDLAGKRLGVQVDYGYGIDFSAIDNLELVAENHMIQNLLNLLNGRVDLVIGDLRTTNYHLHQYLADQVGQFQVVPIKLPGRARHIAASRAVDGHEAMVAAFNKALAEAKKDGSYQAILDKWDARYKSLK